MYILRIFKILRGCLFMKITAKLVYRQKILHLVVYSETKDFM